MNQGMPEPGAWPRDDLVAMLGQPDEERTQVSRSEDRPDGQHIFTEDVDKDTIGATRVMYWRCSCVATSDVRGNDDDRWEIFRTCSKHRQAGLKGRFDDPLDGGS